MSEHELQVNKAIPAKNSWRSSLAGYAACLVSGTPGAWPLFASEYGDDDVGKHMRRVGRLSALLALAVGLPPREIALLRVAAPLHDVGKIGVPDYILGKPGKLTHAEFNQMKSHTLIGAKILGASGCVVLQVARQIALSHHERWDGMGYPQGLAGEMIPLPARITAIADVFDALTHDRPYKKAWDLKRATEAIKKESGRHFDPTLVYTFLSMLHSDKVAATRHKSGRRESIAALQKQRPALKSGRP